MKVGLHNKKSRGGPPEEPSLASCSRVPRGGRVSAHAGRSADFDEAPAAGAIGGAGRRQIGIWHLG
eukprot:scaffold207207_cov35-Tisochrysis_lutea.AAC.5